jgi:hypothetical protein
MDETIRTKLRAIVGLLFRGAKAYVKVRYGVDVDEILKQRETDGSANSQGNR